jgi:hypothetical protein
VHSRYHCCPGNAIILHISVCVCVHRHFGMCMCLHACSLTKHAKCICRIILPSHHKMCLLIFSATFIQNIPHSEKNSLRYFHNCEKIFMLSTCNSYHILMKLEFSEQIFEESSHIKFNQNLSHGSQVVLCGWMY